MLNMNVTGINVIADYSTSKVAWLHGLDARRTKLAAVLVPPHRSLPIILVDWRPIPSPMSQLANRYLVG
jgi:hypothetical protein